MAEEEVVLETDERGRVTIPAEIREKLGITEKSRIDIVIKDVEQKKDFMEECEGLIEGAGDAVDLTHEAFSHKVKKEKREE